MWVSYPMHPHLLSPPCWAAGRPVVTISIGAMDHCLSPYDYIKNTSKMPSDTAGQASLQVLMVE